MKSGIVMNTLDPNAKKQRSQNQKKVKHAKENAKENARKRDA